MSRPSVRWFTILAAVLGTLGWSSAALAGGFEVPENGTRAAGRAGAYAAAADEPSAIYFNPAALSQINGFALTVNANLWLMSQTFSRAPFTTTLSGGEDVTLTYETAEQQNGIFPAPMIFMSYDFGLEDWGFGLGVYGPSGVGNVDFPNADLDELSQIEVRDSAPRSYGHGFLVEDADMLLVYFSAAAAYDFGPVQVGLTLQVAWLSSSFQNGSDGGGFGDPQANADEAPSLYTPAIFDTSGVTGTGIVGIRYQPIPPLTFALSYRPRHKINASGTLDIEFPPALTGFISQSGDDATLEVTLPDVIRFGARWAFLRDGVERGDLELDIVWEGWSITEAFDVRFDVNTLPAGQVRAVPDAYIPKGYNDTLSLRLGGGFHVTDALELRAGSFYEGASNGNFFEEGAISSGYANLDFPSYQRLGFSLGGSYVIGAWSIDLAYMYVFSPTWEETNGQVDILFPLWVCQDPQNDFEREECGARQDSPLHAVNNGTYDVDYHLFSLGFTVNIN
ncbi:MAG: outer membrane protein transport protein [Myxococcales bacterium]|nr:outer membrane protein transport protein [Myxococcales bacterium]